MNANVFAANPLAVAFRNRFIEQLASARAILVLSAAAEPMHVRTAQGAALSIIKDVFSALAFGYAETIMCRESIDAIAKPLSRSSAVLSLVLNHDADADDDTDGDTVDLAIGAAVTFLEEAMEALEREVA